MVFVDVSIVDDLGIGAGQLQHLVTGYVNVDVRRPVALGSCCRADAMPVRRR
jgi:hypothetical protein